MKFLLLLPIKIYLVLCLGRSVSARVNHDLKCLLSIRRLKCMCMCAPTCSYLCEGSAPQFGHLLSERRIANSDRVSCVMEFEGVSPLV